jgi:hypothetical protein
VGWKVSPDLTDPARLAREAAAGSLNDPTERSTAVWREWLSSMARDAEAALAAAIAYRDMDAVGRERWLDSLVSDSAAVDVPRIALYAPLLSVETDPERRLRLLTEIGDDVDAALPREKQRGFSGHGKDGFAVHVLVLPLYLDFVQVLACGTQHGRFVWVRHDPIVLAPGAPRAFQQLEGVRLETMPVKSVLDELAKTVLSHRRQGLELQEALLVLVDLLGTVGP